MRSFGVFSSEVTNNSGITLITPVVGNSITFEHGMPKGTKG